MNATLNTGGSALTDYQKLQIAMQTGDPAQLANGNLPVQNIVPVVTPSDSAVTIPNVAAVDNSGSVQQNNTGVVVAIAAVGLGALLLTSNQGKKVMQGIAGKKQKNKKQASLLPFLLVGGAAAWYFFHKDSEQPAGTATTNNSTADTSTYPTTTTTSATPAQPVSQPIVAPIQVQTVARGFVASIDQTALARDWPATADVVKTMTDSEVIAMYNYFYNFVLPGLKLYQYPPAPPATSWPDGSFNTTLYNSIAAIKTKYSLNI